MIPSRILQVTGLCGVAVLVIVACAPPAAVIGQSDRSRPAVRCRIAPELREADPLTCGFVIGTAAGPLCEDVSLAPRRMRSAFQQGVAVSLADSSVLVAEVRLDTLDDNFVVVTDPCAKPLQGISRDWRFLPQDRAVAVFRSVVDYLERSRKAPSVTCVLDSRPPPARRSYVLVVVDESATRRIVVLSKDEQTVPSTNSFVQVVVVPIDSASEKIRLMGSQRFAPCQDALKLAESSAR